MFVEEVYWVGYFCRFLRIDLRILNMKYIVKYFFVFECVC